VTVCCASGDTARVYYPAASPQALACGGTVMDVVAGAVVAETVWNDASGATGGGFSQTPRPAWQQLPTWSGGRGVPDVAAHAASYWIVSGSRTVAASGTSAAAPLWAALIALCNHRLDQLNLPPAGFINDVLYQGALAGGLVDITVGTNGPYRASKGWDPCTGLGRPRGAPFLDSLVAVRPAPAPVAPVAPVGGPSPAARSKAAPGRVPAVDPGDGDAAHPQTDDVALLPATLDGPSQHVALFSVELLADADGSIRRTQVKHVQSSAEATWAGWDGSRLAAFLAGVAGLDIGKAAPDAPPATPARTTATKTSSGATAAKDAGSRAHTKPSKRGGPSDDNPSKRSGGSGPRS
jgi:hypothetical protein